MKTVCCSKEEREWYTYVMRISKWEDSHIEISMCFDIGVVLRHYSDVIMSMKASQITGVSIVYSIICSDVDQRKHQRSALMALCVGNSPVTGEFPAQRTSNAEQASIWWRHHGTMKVWTKWQVCFVITTQYTSLSAHFHCPIYLVNNCVIDHTRWASIKNRESSWCQLCRHWDHKEMP